MIDHCRTSTDIFRLAWQALTPVRIIGRVLTDCVFRLNIVGSRGSPSLRRVCNSLFLKVQRTTGLAFDEEQ